MFFIAIILYLIKPEINFLCLLVILYEQVLIKLFYEFDLFLKSCLYNY